MFVQTHWDVSKVVDHVFLVVAALAHVRISACLLVECVLNHVYRFSCQISGHDKCDFKVLFFFLMKNKL